MRKKQNKKKYAKFLNKVRKIFKQINISKKKVLAILACSTLTILLTFVTYNLNNPTYMNKLFANVLNNGTPANEAFDDNTFYSCVVDAYNNEFNANKAYSDILTDDELEQIHTLNCSGSGIADSDRITSIKGIEKLTNITSINLESHKLTSVDLSKNTALTTLDLQGNQLTDIDLRQNTALIELNLRFNHDLTSLSLDGLVSLEKLDLYSTSLTEIDLTSNVSLKDLNLAGNKLKSINLNNNVLLENLDLGYGTFATSNNITSIDLSKNTNLKTLNVDGNGLTSLDLSSNINLTSISFINRTSTQDYKNELIPEFKQSLTIGDKIDIGTPRIKVPANYNIDYTVEDSSVVSYSNGIISALKGGTTNLKLNSNFANSPTLSSSMSVIDPNIFLSSSTYTINNENKFIVVGVDDNADTIKQNITASAGDIVVDEEKNTLKVNYNGVDVLTYALIGYKIDDYNMVTIDNSKPWLSRKDIKRYIYLRNNNFDESKIRIRNCNYTLNDSWIDISYNNVTVDHINYSKININESYKLINSKLYVGTDDFNSYSFDAFNCSVTETETEPHSYKYNIKIGNTVVDTIDVVRIDTNYPYTESLKNSNYIYLGGKDLDSFNVINGFYEETNDELIIYDSEGKNYELNRIKLLRITSEKYDLVKSYSNNVYYIYTGFDSYETEIVTENGTKETITERIDRTKINLPEGFALNYDGWANYSICDNITCYETISAVFISDSYDYKLTKDYVYFGFMDYLKPNYYINVTNGKGKLNGDKFDIYTANNVYCTSIPIVAVESYYANEEYMDAHEIDGYDYNKKLGALYLGTDSFDPLRISKKINAETQYSTDDNKLVIKYDGKEIETINIINLYMPDMYKFIGGTIYTKADTLNKDMVKEITSLKDIDKNKVNIINGKLGVEEKDHEDDDGNIYYTDEFSICPLGYVSKYEEEPFKDCFELGNFNILSDDYNFNKDYIYVGPGELKKNIKFNNWGEIVSLEKSLMGGVELAVSDDTIELWEVDTECDDEYINGEYVETCYVNERILKIDEWKIVRATSAKYDLESDKIVLKENEKFDISDIKVVNGKAELKDNMLLIKYKDEIVKKIKIEGKFLNNSTTTKTTSKDGTNKKTALKKTTTSIKNNINKTTTTKKKNIYPTTTKRIVNDIGSSKQKELNMLYKQGDNKLVIIYLLIMYNLLLMGLIFILKSKFNDKLMSNL